MDALERPLVIQPVILAAGRGKRILEEAVSAGLGERPKVLYELHGRPLLDYVLAAVEEAALQLRPTVILRRPLVVVGFMKELVERQVGERGLCVEQRPAPLGTGHAVLVTEPAVPPEAAGVLVLNGDMPAWRPETLVRLCRRFAAERPTVALGTVTFSDPIYSADFFAYGRIIRDERGMLRRITEQRDASPTERAVAECNPSLYCFDRRWLFSALRQISNDNSQQEYYLTDLLEIARQADRPVLTEPSEDWREALGVNTLDQLRLAESLLK